MDYSASLEKSKEEKLEYIYSFANYINKNNSQALLGFRNNIYVSGFNYAKLNDVDDVVSAVEEWEKSKDAVSKEKVTNFDFFKYTNYNDLSKYNELTDEEKINKLYINKYILRYEDFIIQNSTGSAASYLTSETSITDSINKGIWLQNDNNTDPITITTSSQLIGAFLYPNILSTAQVLTDGKQFSYKSISVGGSVSIPIVFEYYVEASLSSITKSLYFDLRNSLINDPIHFMIEVTGNFDYSTTGEIYSDIDKLDE
jgi:hypothetical protein